MKRMVKIVIMSIGSICILALLSWLGLRIYTSYQFYNSASKVEQGYGHVLPVKFSVSNKISGKKINLGYSNFRLPTEKINKILLVKGGNGLVIQCDKFEVRMLPIFKINTQVFERFFPNESILKKPTVMKKCIEKIMCQPDSEGLMSNLFWDYRWKKLALSNRHKNLMEILFSSPDALALYTIFMKERNSYTQQGIGLLQTDSIKSIIFLGNSDVPGEMMAYIWSKNGKITQTIAISSNSHKLSEKTIRNILSSFKYTVRELPSEKKLKEMIVTNIKQRKEDIIFK